MHTTVARSHPNVSNPPKPPSTIHIRASLDDVVNALSSIPVHRPTAQDYKDRLRYLFGAHTTHLVAAIAADVPDEEERDDSYSESGKALSTQVGGSHYKAMKIQHAEFCHVNKLGWCESSAIKYLCRHGSKNKAEDVKKAIHYCQILLQLEYPEAAEASIPAKS